eukprot:jgi/Botrbrau1/2004/Bobra.0052s0044.1
MGPSGSLVLVIVSGSRCRCNVVPWATGPSQGLLKSCHCPGWCRVMLCLPLKTLLSESQKDPHGSWVSCKGS